MSLDKNRTSRPFNANNRIIKMLTTAYIINFSGMILLPIFAWIYFSRRFKLFWKLMLAYRNIDLSTIPSIPAAQLELAKQQVAAYWSAPVYIALLGMLERVFAICLHVSLSVMVLYSIAGKKPALCWIAVAWHTLVDGVAVYVGQKIGTLNLEALIGVMAIISLGIVFLLRKDFPQGRISST